MQESPLYNCKSEKFLAKLLNIQYPLQYKTIKNSLTVSPLLFYKFWTKIHNGKEREFFECKPLIKNLHNRIKYFITKKIDYPKYLFSGVKGKSYLKNASIHEGQKFYFLLDIKSFYPSITQEKIESLLISYFRQSKDVAHFLSLLVTVPQKNNGELVRALATGSPLSQIFAFIINQKMFDEINIISRKNAINFSVYVDDLSFSSTATIPYKFLRTIFHVIKKNGYKIASKKVHYGRLDSNPEITGIQFNKNGIFITNKREAKIIRLCKLITDKKIQNINFDKELLSLQCSIKQANLVNPIYNKYLEYTLCK